MRRGRILIFLVLIVVVGLGLVVVVLNQGGGPIAQPTQAALTEIFYAAQNIPQGTPITLEMLGKFSIPPENVAEVMFTAAEQDTLVGQTARINIEQGTPITSAMVGPAVETTGPLWAVQIPASMVAVAVPTNRLALAAYGISDGAHVNVNACMIFVDVDPSYQTVLPNYVSVVRDVFFPTDGKERPYLSIEPLTSGETSRQGRTEIDPTFQKPIYTIPSEAQRPRLVCQTILQNVLVMKVGNFGAQTPPQQDPNATPSPAQAQQQAQQASPDIVTLMVNPQDSIYLNYFVYSGAMLTMNLRNPNDTSRFAAESATLTSLLTQYNISIPSKLPYASQRVAEPLSPPVLPNDIVTSQQPQQ